MGSQADLSTEICIRDDRFNLAKVECQTLCQQHLQQQQYLIPIVHRQAIASTTSTTSTTSTRTTILPKVQRQALRQANELPNTTVATGLVLVEIGRPENYSKVIEGVLRRVFLLELAKCTL